MVEDSPKVISLNFTKNLTKDSPMDESNGIWSKIDVDLAMSEDLDLVVESEIGSGGSGIL